MRVLVACEFSGIVRDAFVARGHDAMSCDLLPCESPRTDSWDGHYQGDVLELLSDPSYEFDLMIAHPPCTYFTNSAVTWLWNTPKKPKTGVLYGKERWIALDKAAGFFNALLQAPITRIAVENPIPHKYAIERIEGYNASHKYDQKIQPYQFGHPESKATCLWLKGLPKLKPTNIVELPKDPALAQKNHYLSPSPTRWKLRSLTYQGIAEAFASQWGELE